MLKELFVNISINYLKNNNVCDKKQEKIFKYTLESLYSFITKSFVILLISIFFKTFYITLLMLILYSILRGFSFGIHANKNIYCWIISLTLYSLLPFLITNLKFNLYFNYFSFIIGLIAILLWAPADTKSRPLINKQKRLINKFITFFIAILFITFSFITNNENLKEITCIILLLNTVCICPITYFIFKQPYKNYRFYKG